ncbi:MAG: hypothetical protein ACK53Y_10735, partial [bacterium]
MRVCVDLCGDAVRGEVEGGVASGARELAPQPPRATSSPSTTAPSSSASTPTSGPASRADPHPHPPPPHADASPGHWPLGRPGRAR